MTYWIIFISTSLIVTFIIEYKIIDDNVKQKYLIVLILFISWFAGFRDGLGEDYAGYAVRMLDTEYIERMLNFDPDVSWAEPGYNIFAIIIYSTPLSEVFFFLVFSFITNYFLIKSFLRYKYLFFIILIFLTSGLYFMSFNLTRQMCAASMFLYSCKYIEDRKPMMYLIIILLASTIHRSALFLVPLYPLATLNISKRISICLLALSFLLGPILKIDLRHITGNINFFYDVYIKISEESFQGSGFFTYLANAILFLIIFGKNKIVSNRRENIVFNLALLFVILSNFVFSLYYLFRFALFFSSFLIIITPRLIDIYNKYLTRAVIIFFYIFIFMYSLLLNIENSKIVPKSVKPLSSIFK